MGDRTAIPWTDSTLNPVVGCSPAGKGCRNCYASELHERSSKAKLAGAKLPEQYALPFSKVQIFPERLGQALSWREPRKIFLCSTGDLFHEQVPDEFIAATFRTMAMARRHTFQVLTKRPGRARKWYEWSTTPRTGSAGESYGVDLDTRRSRPWPLPNVWLGTSCSTQAEVERNVPELLATPAEVRFLSLEPMIEAIDLRDKLGQWSDCPECGRDVLLDEDGCCYVCGEDAFRFGLDWVIAGCESGSKRRPCSLEWVRAIVEQCREAEVPCFVKQLDLGGRLSRDPSEWPEDLRVQEFPEER